MKYFLHDTNSFDDEKITKLYINFGYEGLGLFYTLLEKIGKQEKPVDTTVLKTQLKVGKRLEKCWKFMEEIDLISSKNGETFNEQLLNFSETYQIKKEKNREKIAEWREKQKDTKSVTSYVPVSNLPKVKLSKVNIIKEREEGFIQQVEKFKNYPAYMLKEFIDYWSEQNPSGKKMRFELEKTWDLKRRLERWSANSKLKAPTSKKQPDEARTGRPMTQAQVIAHFKEHGEYPNQ